MEKWQPQSELFLLNFRFAQVVLFLVAAGIALGMVRVLFRRRLPRPGEMEIQRHSVGVALSHWGNAVGFILCLVTGFAILPYLQTSISKANLYLVHFIGAGLMLITLLAVIVQANLGGTKRRMFPARADFRALWLELLSYTGLVGNEGFLGFKSLQWPVSWRRIMEKVTGYQANHNTGKYLATEKVLSYPIWTIIILVVVGSGIFKAMRYIFPVPPVVLEWSTRLHGWSLWAGLIMLLVHAGALILVRTNWPLLGSMLTTRVSESYARTRHPLWHVELMAEAAKTMDADQEAPPVAVQAETAAAMATPRGRFK